MNGSEERREPVVADLAVSVEKYDYLSVSGDGAVVTGTDETLAFGVPD